MDPDPSPVQAPTDFTAPLLEKLKRHPKRIVFTEGEDLRVLRVAERLVKAQAAVPILLGNRQRIRQLAKENSVDLTWVNVLEPKESGDFALFCRRLVKIERYRRMEIKDPADIMARPHYFGAMMVQYGQADALIGGNLALPATLFRALLHTIKPLPEVPRIFATTVMTGSQLQHFGGDGLVFFSDSGLTPNPKPFELASIAVETGKLAHHILGRPPRVAMLSHSTKGSAGTEEARKVVAATAIAEKRVRQDELLEMFIDGEVQADVAMDPDAAEVKLADPGVRKSADVLVFPNLDAANICVKLLRHCAGATTYGQLLLGLARPTAQVSRTATEETIFGVAALVGVEAIKFHELYPDGEV